MTAQQIREMLALLASIEAKLGHIEGRLAHIEELLAQPERLEFVEWAEPPRSD